MIDPATRLYRALIYLYPADFRREFGDQMAQCFYDLSRTALNHNRVALWAHLLTDLAFSLTREHFDHWIRRRTRMNTPLADFAGYRVQAQIGDGSVSRVFRAFDPRLKAEVAIKQLKPAAELGTETLAQWQAWFEHGAAILAGLDHPALPKLYASGRTAAGPYVVMEYIPGSTLLERIEQSEGFLDEHDLIQWGIQACAALTFLHTCRPQAFLFRDIKPSNLIVADTGTLRLLDFDITAAYIDGQNYECIGTPGYAAPEQYAGHAEPRSDLYALGATLHHLATRIDPREETKTHPFSFAPARSVNPALSKSFAAVIERAIAYEVEDRWPSAAEMQAALEACL